MGNEFAELRAALSKDFKVALTDAEKRLANQIKAHSGDLSQQMKAHSGDLSQQMKAHSGDLAKQMKAHSKDLSQQMKAHSEHLSDLVKKGAEGYGGTLEAVAGELKTLSTKWDTKVEDHDRVLKNHTERLEQLEQR